MKKTEFARQYQRMETVYGIKTDAHLQEWQLQFGHLGAKDFEGQVTKVIAEFRPFGRDKWPTPGDFNFIIETGRQAANLGLSPDEI